MRSAERRHQSLEWTVLSQVNCVVHIEVAGFQILLNGFHPCNTRTSQWSPPASCGGSCEDLFCICFIRHSCIVSEQGQAPWLDYGWEMGLKLWSKLNLTAAPKQNKCKKKLTKKTGKHEITWKSPERQSGWIWYNILQKCSILRIIITVIRTSVNKHWAVLTSHSLMLLSREPVMTYGPGNCTFFTWCKTHITQSQLSIKTNSYSERCRSWTNHRHIKCKIQCIKFFLNVHSSGYTI